MVPVNQDSRLDRVANTFMVHFKEHTEETC